MADFDWRTDDDDTWPAESGEVGKQKKRPSWLYPLLLIIIVAVSGLALYSLIERRAEAAEEVVKADVRRTHELVMDAAESGDVELFTTFLSGANVNWQNIQREAVSRGLFDEVPWLGFRAADQPYRLDEVTISPSLDEAVVTYTRWYFAGDRPSQPYPLQQTAVYRRGEDRWLLAPPNEEFWGEERTIEEGALTIVYPQRDEKMVERLAEDILASIPEICRALPSGDCPQTWALTLELSSNLANEIFPPQIEGEIDHLALTLPAPTLVGLPMDGYGYGAMAENYKSLLQRRLTASMNSWLAVSPEQLPPFFEANSAAADLEGIMTFACAGGTVGRFTYHVFRYSPGSGEWGVLFERTYEGDDSGFIIPIPGGESYIIQEYLRGELLTARLLLWQEGEVIEIAEQTVNFDNALDAPFFMREADPTGRYLVVNTSIDDETEWDLLDRRSCSADSGCEMVDILNVPVWSPTGQNMLMREPGPGNQLAEARTLYRADSSARNPVEVGVGMAPFWLDDGTYGYSRVNEAGEVELVVADVADDRPIVWVETADLQAAVPDERRWNQMTIWNVWANPADSSMVLLMTTPGAGQNSGPYDFFLVDGEPAAEGEQRIEWLFSHDFPASTSDGSHPFSPDGRYLLVPQRGTAIAFQDLETGERLDFDLSYGFFVGWSPDGRYYIQRSEEGLTLTSPSTGSQVQILYDFSTCSGLQWLEAQDN